MEQDGKRRIVVTSALPYANGNIHIGHLVEYIQTDIWVRFQKMRGNECVYVCAADTHGTPVMIRARQEGTTPEELVERMRQEHLRDFTDFQVAFDNYYTTNSPENKALSERIYAAMEKAGAISRKTSPQLWCEHCKMSLPDRFVKGICPKCGAPNQYGDSCDKCGSTYGAEELLEPHCTTCGGVPTVRDSEQLYFELEPLHDYLKAWLPQHTPSDVSNKLLEWFDEPLRGWCISRDAPYFGFEIPGHPGKFFYVWVDAPIGYIASLENWCKKNGKDLADYWPSNSCLVPRDSCLESANCETRSTKHEARGTELYHFIGKDIIRFHCLFWPGMLKTAGFKEPDKVFVHGFLTVNGEKMSKSKGTFVSARTYLDHLPPEALRYYYAAKMGGTTDDMDLNLADFVQRVNSDLVGKITNIASRSAQMLQKKLGGKLGALDDAGRELVAKCQAASEKIAQLYEDRRFNLAIVEICKLADAANAYFDDRSPWKTVKEDAELTRTTLTAALNAFRIIAIYLKSVLPAYADKAMALFGEKDWTWQSAQTTVENAPLGPYEYLANRIDAKQIDAMIASALVKPGETGEVSHESRASKNKGQGSRVEGQGSRVEGQGDEVKAAALKPEIAFPDFEKLDLRIGVVESCEIVPKSSKLLKFVLDAGSLGKRTIFSGIRAAYPDPSVMVGKEVVFVANLAPRKMSVGVSEGMILFAGEPGECGGAVSPTSQAGAGREVT